MDAMAIAASGSSPPAANTNRRVLSIFFIKAIQRFRDKIKILVDNHNVIHTDRHFSRFLKEKIAYPLVNNMTNSTHLPDGLWGACTQKPRKNCDSY
jgi:restriction endonuclease